MVTFDDKLNPKNKLRLRFKYKPRAFQYLDFFKITTGYPIYKFVPLNLTFGSWDELLQFLIARGIVYDVVDIRYSDTVVESEATVVDTTKIYEVEESVTKYLLTFKYYSINEVAEMLSLSRPTVYKFVNDASLKAIRINGQFRINHMDLISFINAESQKNIVN